MSAAGGGRRTRGGAGAGGPPELTVLDLLPRGPGRSEGEALADTLALAERAEGFGYARFWVAEHQGTRSPALGCPELLVGPAAARTRRLRVGTAGVLLRYYSPLKVAETFRCLEALYPGRIDLGVARGHADDELGASLLDGRPEPTDAAAYRAKVGRLLYFLGIPSGPGGPEWLRPVPGAPPALPAPPTRPEVWLLGAGEQGAALAAEYGTAFSFALFLRPDLARAAGAIAAYRAGFRPSAALARATVEHRRVGGVRPHPGPRGATPGRRGQPPPGRPGDRGRPAGALPRHARGTRPAARHAALRLPHAHGRPRLPHRVPSAAGAGLRSGWLSAAALPGEAAGRPDDGAGRKFLRYACANREVCG